LPYSKNPLHQASGEVERVNRTLLKSLKIAHSKSISLHKKRRQNLVAHRSTLYSTAGVVAFTLMFEEMETKLPCLHSKVNAKLLQAAADRDAVNKARAKHYADAKAKAVES